MDKNNQNVLYRSGPQQNIKIFKPQKSEKNIAYYNTIKSFNKIYATDDISYAAGFCFDWADEEGFIFGKNHSPWVLKVPKKYKSQLNNSCSMYKIDGTNFIKAKGTTTPEYISIEPAKVLKEIKFNTCWDCLKKYKVIVKINSK